MDARRLMAMVLGSGLMVVAACGGGGGGGGGTPDSGTQAKCTIDGVSVTASATAVPAGQLVDLGANVKQAQGATGCNGGVSWSTSPAGAITGTQLLAAKFQTSTPGTYTVTATSVDDSTKSGSVQISVQAPSGCGTPNGTVVTHSGNITADETWAGNGVTHSITSSVRIKPGATVTVQGCAIVAIATGQEIGVEGDTTNNVPAKLVAAGTDVDDFVSFVPAAQGQTWAGIRGYNVQSLVEMHYAVVVSAGYGSIYRNAAIVMAGPGLAFPPQGVLTADNLVVENPVGGGIFLDSMGAFTAQSTSLGVTGAQDHPIAMHLMAVSSIPPTQVKNSVRDDALMLTSAPNVTLDTTIHPYLPLYFETGVKVGQFVANPQPVTLTIEGGSQLRFAPGNDIRLYFGNQSAGAGILMATGDAADPIVFTSAASAALPGGTAPAPADWAGLLFLNSQGSQLSYVTVEYAGASNGWVSVNCRPQGSSDNAAILVDEVPAANFLTNSTIRNVSGHGIDATWTAGTVNDPDIAAGNTFNNVTGCKQTYNAKTGGCGTTFGCTE